MADHGTDEAELDAALRNRKLWDILRARLDQSHAVMMARYHVAPQDGFDARSGHALSPPRRPAGPLRLKTAGPLRRKGNGASILRGR